MKFKTRYLLGFSVLMPSFLMASSTSGQSYSYLVNAFLCLAVVIMVTLLLLMTKSLITLKQSDPQIKKGGVWINQKLYDFNAEQLRILIKKINKVENND